MRALCTRIWRIIFAQLPARIMVLLFGLFVCLHLEAILILLIARH
jgi:hypothetical protein